MADETHDLVARLKKIEGQVRGIQRMIEEKRECYEIIGQVMACRAALDKVAVLVANNQIDDCLNGADSEIKEEAKRVLQETIKAALKFK